MISPYDGVMNNTQVFPQEYFSGTDVYIAFNHVPIDEIVSIQFAINEPIIPIYGYASYTYDAVAHGARIVTGSFRINFKEAWYIRSAMTKISIDGVNSANPKSPKSDMTPEEIAKWMSGKPNEDIQKWVNGYEARIWGVEGADPIQRYQEPFFANKLSPDGTKPNPLSNDGFDIILAYGNELIELGSYVDEFPGTVKMINGVHLTGVTQIVQPTGEAIFEEYSFIAKDLDNTLLKK